MGPPSRPPPPLGANLAALRKKFMKIASVKVKYDYHDSESFATEIANLFTFENTDLLADVVDVYRDQRQRDVGDVLDELENTPLLSDQQQTCLKTLLGHALGLFFESGSQKEAIIQNNVELFRNNAFRQLTDLLFKLMEKKADELSEEDVLSLRLCLSLVLPILYLQLHTFILLKKRLRLKKHKDALEKHAHNSGDAEAMGKGSSADHAYQKQSQQKRKKKRTKKKKKNGSMPTEEEEKAAREAKEQADREKTVVPDFDILFDSMIATLDSVAFGQALLQMLHSSTMSHHHPTTKFLLVLWKYLQLRMGSISAANAFRRSRRKKAGLTPSFEPRLSNEGNVAKAKCYKEDIDAFVERAESRFEVVVDHLTGKFEYTRSVQEGYGILKKHHYTPLHEKHEEEDKEFANNWQRNAMTDELSDDFKSMRDKHVEVVYRQLSSQLLQHVRTLLIVLLQCFSDKVETQRKAWSADMLLDAKAKFNRISIKRTQEIAMKAVSGSMLLLLKYFKSNHYLQFEHMCMHMVDCKGMTLILKVLNVENIEHWITAYNESVGEQALAFLWPLHQSGPNPYLEETDGSESDIADEDFDAMFSDDADTEGDLDTGLIADAVNHSKSGDARVGGTKECETHSSSSSQFDCTVEDPTSRNHPVATELVGQAATGANPPHRELSFRNTFLQDNERVALRERFRELALSSLNEPHDSADDDEDDDDGDDDGRSISLDGAKDAEGSSLDDGAADDGNESDSSTTTITAGDDEAREIGTALVDENQDGRSRSSSSGTSADTGNGDANDSEVVEVASESQATAETTGATNTASPLGSDRDAFLQRQRDFFSWDDDDDDNGNGSQNGTNSEDSVGVSSAPSKQTGLGVGKTSADPPNFFEQFGDGPGSKSSGEESGDDEEEDEEDDASGSIVCKRNLFTCITLVRILQKLIKHKPSRQVPCGTEHAAPILKKCLVIDHPMLQLYLLKLMKNLTRFLSKGWKKTHMTIISKIDQTVTQRIVDDWYYASEFGQFARNQAPDDAEEERIYVLVQHFLAYHYDEKLGRLLHVVGDLSLLNESSPIGISPTDIPTAEELESALEEDEYYLVDSDDDGANIADVGSDLDRNTTANALARMLLENAEGTDANATAIV